MSLRRPTLLRLRGPRAGAERSPAGVALLADIRFRNDIICTMPEIRHSVCALDCPDCCSVLVTVQDGRATKLRGNPDHPVTRGFLCGKVAQYLEREYHPDRLLYPQRRIGRQGRRPLRAHLLGRGARRNRRAPARRRARVRPRSRSCPTATPAPWGCSTTPAWTAASSTGWAPRGSTAPSAPRPAAPG